MISKKQIEDLANNNQIDSFTILREYLQILFLSYLYREKQADKIYFKGGTALRLLFGSPRFSEDLDFSTPYSEIVIKSLMSKLEKSIQIELPGINIVPLHTGKNTSRFRLIFKSDEYKYPFVIRLDYNRINKTGKILVSPVVTKFPVALFPLITHLTDKEILAEKISAMIIRAKGRDFFDVWFLLEKGIPVDYDLLKDKLLEREKKFEKEDILRQIKSQKKKNLYLDLNQFLPKSHRRFIPVLQKKLIEKFN